MKGNSPVQTSPNTAVQESNTCLQRWRGRIQSSPAFPLCLLLLLFVLLQSFLPLGSAVKIGADEGFELSKPILCLHGYKLYTDIWDDQPPLYTFLITEIVRHVSHSILYPRLLTVGFSILLLFSFHFLVRKVSGVLVASVATLIFVASPGFLELSCSCMQEILALAPVIASLSLLLTMRHTKRHRIEIASGILFAVGLQLKLIGLIYFPLLLFSVWLRHDSIPFRFRATAGSGLLIVLSAAAGFLAINTITGNPVLLQLQQAWASHFGSAKSFEYGSPAARVYQWIIVVRNWDMVLPAIAGLAVLVAQMRTCPASYLPVIWILITFVVFPMHRPWWSYYYVHNALPLSWCAAVGLVTGWTYVRAGRSRLRTASFGVIACSLVAWMGGRLYVEEVEIRSIPRLESCLILQEVQRFKPFTTFMFSDQPVFSFHAFLPEPPRLAMLSLKRMWSGEMSNARLVEELELAKPGIILWLNTTQEVPFQELLRQEYRLVYEDRQNRLFVHKNIAKRPYE